MITPSDDEIRIPPTLADEIYRYLENEILSGRLKGGTRLVLRQIAEKVGTSTIPVRDAIGKLQEVGLAVSAPRKGAVVKEFSTEELIETYRLRLLLEGEATRLATRHATPEAIARMRELLTEVEHAAGSRRIGEAMQAEAALYRLLYAFAGNGTLCTIIEMLWKQSHLYRLTGQLHDTDQVLPLVTAATIDAVDERDPERAEAARREGIQGSLDRLIALSGSSESSVS